MLVSFRELLTHRAAALIAPSATWRTGRPYASAMFLPGGHSGARHDSVRLLRDDERYADLRACDPQVGTTQLCYQRPSRARPMAGGRTAS